MIRSTSVRAGRRAYEVRPRPDFVPGLLVVRIKEDTVSHIPDVHNASAASVRTFRMPDAIADPVGNLRRKGLLREVVPVFAQPSSANVRRHIAGSAAAAFATSVRDSENEDLRGINLLRLSKAANLTQVEKELRGTRGIDYVQRVPARWLAAAKPKATSADPLVNRQWGLRAIRWFDAHLLPDARAVNVAVLDTGIDRAHPELKGVHAYVHDGASATDIVGHGTHVAGIIAAHPNNQVGIAGICRCDLRVWKIFGDEPADDGDYYVDELMYQRALNAVHNAGIRVMNFSIGGTQSSRTEALLFQRLISGGCTVVAAMGNEYLEGNPTEYPAAYPGVVAVGATNEANRRASFSNTGKHISLAAPGENIFSTLPLKPSPARGAAETHYAAWSGTSMATPHVTAAATLILARNPGDSPAQVAERLERGATKVPGMGGKKRTTAFGSGLLNLVASLS